MVLGVLKAGQGIASLAQKAKNLATQQKRAATAQKRYDESYASDPAGHDDLERWLQSQGKVDYVSPYPPYKAPMQYTKPASSQPSVEIDSINWDSVLGKKVNVKKSGVKRTTDPLWN